MNTAVWDDRLISRHRAADLAGTWQLMIDRQYLRCVVCGGNVTMLPVYGKVLNVDGMIAAVLGHMVKCHNYSLSGGEQRGDLAEQA